MPASHRGSAAGGQDASRGRGLAMKHLVDEAPSTLWRSAQSAGKGLQALAGSHGRREGAMAAAAESRQGLLANSDDIGAEGDEEWVDQHRGEEQVRDGAQRGSGRAEMDDTNAQDDAGNQMDHGHDGPHLGMCALLGLMTHAFGYGLFYASVGVLLLPQEALHMFADQHAIFLAVMLALAGMSQLISPLAGYYSDRTCSRMGRRVPYILVGNLVLFLCMGAMWLARTNLHGYAYLFLLLIAVIALNVAYTGFTGLVSDVVPSSQMGFASGIMGAMTAAGAVAGLVFLGYLGEDRIDWAYSVYAGAVFVCTPLTYFSVPDRPLAREEAKPSSCAELLQAYWISPASHGDFFWVFVSRTFYYMAVSVQIYILYYLRDNFRESDPKISENAQTYTAVLCVLSQGASGIVAGIAGTWCDGFGRKPCIYLSCVGMALVYVGYCFVSTYPAVIALGLCYGSTNGVYLAVDYALAVECLPRKEDHAKDLALWGIAAFLGTMFGPCISGPLLSYVGKTEDPQHYSPAGYNALMITGVVYSLVCGAVVTRVSRDHKEDTQADATLEPAGEDEAPDAV